MENPLNNEMAIIILVMVLELILLMTWAICFLTN